VRVRAGLFTLLPSHLISCWAAPYAVLCTIVHSTQLLYTVLCTIVHQHRSALYTVECTVLYCIVHQHRTVLYSNIHIVLHSTAEYPCGAQCSTILYRRVSISTALSIPGPGHCTAPHYTALTCTALPLSILGLLSFSYDPADIRPALHCTALHSSVQSIVPRSAQYILHSTVRCTVHRAHCTLHTAHCKLHTAQYSAVYSAPCTVQ
jgi:hypothetical protein